MISRPSWLALVIVLVAQAALLWRPMHEDSATVDEPVMLGAGYSYWHGHRYFLNVEHPPLAQLANALPVIGAPAPTNAFAIYPDAARWDNLAVPIESVFPNGTNFYYVSVLEAEESGREFTFSGPDVLVRGRVVPVLMTLATTILVFAWSGGNVVAAMAWAFNPVALAHGHLATTDAAAALFLPLALWMFSRFTEKPVKSRAAVAGVALGVALLVKFTAIALVPALIIVAWLEARRNREPAWQCAFVRGAVLMGVIVWGLMLLVYAPDWRPAPSVVERLAVPAWFRWLRPVLIPPTFFKGLALVLAHAGRGHESYLLGKWSNTGWWYYFPVAFVLKTPVALLGLLVLRRRNTALIGAAVYFGIAMLSHANLGIRHLLPVYALLAVGCGVRWRWLAGLLAAWLVVVAVWAHPLYIQYFNELAGGAMNGHRYLLDSNFDWGQDAIRLRQFLGNRHVFISYHGRFGALAGIDYTPVTAKEARELHDAWLVVSATNLMKPEWTWLRESYSPETRVAATLFVYRMR